MLVSRLPRRDEQKKALLCGIVGAFVFRSIAVVAATRQDGRAARLFWSVMAAIVGWGLLRRGAHPHPNAETLADEGGAEVTADVEQVEAEAKER